MKNEMFFVLIVAALGCALAVTVGIGAHRGLVRLDHRLDCLEKPHAESSVAGEFHTIDGKRTFVITQPPTRTECP